MLHFIVWVVCLESKIYRDISFSLLRLTWCAKITVYKRKTTKKKRRKSRKRCLEMTGLIWRQSLSNSRRKVFLFNRSLFIKPAGGFVFLTSYTLEEARPSFSSKDPDWSGHIYMTGWLICQSSSEVMEMMSREICCTQEGPAVFHVAVKCPGNSVNSVRHSGCFQIQRWKSKDLPCRRDKREASQDLKGRPI